MSRMGQTNRFRTAFWPTGECRLPSRLTELFLASFFALAGPPFKPPCARRNGGRVFASVRRWRAGSSGVSPVASMTCCSTPNAKSAGSGVFGLCFFLAMLTLCGRAGRIARAVTHPGHPRSREMSKKDLVAKCAVEGCENPAYVEVILYDVYPTEKHRFP